jgi:hypothetical protein
MADYMRASIEFPEEAINVNEIKHAFSIVNSGDVASYASKGVIRLEDTEARWGHFENLELCLQAHGFPYTTYCDAFDMESAGVREYRPGQGEAYYPTMGYLGKRTVLVDELLELKNDPEALMEYVNNIETYASIDDSITEYTGQLTPDYEIDVTPDTQMLIEIKPFTRVYYQLRYKGLLGKVHATKLIEMIVEDHIDYTFFTKEGVQYWLSQLQIIKANK